MPSTAPPASAFVDAYARATRDPSPDARARAAEAWGRWEDVHVSLGPGWRPDPRWQDPPVRDVLATLVTHYWSHSGFGGDEILGRMDRIAHLPGVLIHGRHDVSSPLVTAWRVHRAWPGSELVVVGDGHGGSDSARELERAIARLAVDRS